MKYRKLVRHLQHSVNTGNVKLIKQVLYVDQSLHS